MTAPADLTPERGEADTDPMDGIGFQRRTYRVAEDARGVVCDTGIGAEDREALRAAVAWRRGAMAAAELDDAGSVVALRVLIALDDLLLESDQVLTVDREQAAILCEVAGAYVSERELPGYQPPEHRRRLDLLSALGGPLMDTCSDMAAAEDEARQKALLP